MKRYLIIIEETGTGYSAYSPDLPGCASTGRTREAVEANMNEAIRLHLDGLREGAYEVPEPHSYCTYVEAGASPVAPVYNDAYHCTCGSSGTQRKRPRT